MDQQPPPRPQPPPREQSAQQPRPPRRSGFWAGVAVGAGAVLLLLVLWWILMWVGCGRGMMRRHHDHMDWDDRMRPVDYGLPSSRPRWSLRPRSEQSR